VTPVSAHVPSPSALVRPPSQLGQLKPVPRHIAFVQMR
jgi:hypothetical protein